MATGPSGSSISQMLTQSRDVLLHPGVATFEKYEKLGTLRDAIVYVALAAAISGVLGLTEGIGGFLRNLVAGILGFLIFTYLVHWLGTRRGATGTLDEVAYSFALFWAPLSVLISAVTLILVLTLIGVLLVPLVALAGLALNVYYAYLATQASLNLEPGGATWGVLLLAALGSFLASLILGAILG
jgi:hypothetical protein